MDPGPGTLPQGELWAIRAQAYAGLIGQALHLRQLAAMISVGLSTPARRQSVADLNAEFDQNVLTRRERPPSGQAVQFGYWGRVMVEKGPFAPR